MAGASTQLLSRASRSAIADVAAALTAPDVTKIFTDQGFIAWYSLAKRRDAAPESKLESFLEKARIAGSPRLIAETYLDSVDWTSPAEALAALSAVEDLLWLFEQTGGLEDLYDPLAGDRLRRQLNKDGFRIDRQGRIRPPAQLFLAGSLSSLRDPTLIELVLRRIVHALPDDPMQAIGSAKELVEATSKAVLLQMGRPIPQHADLPELGQKAAEALGLHPKGVDTLLKGGPVLRGLLGKLIGVANDLAALRNVHGTGHAPAELPRGLMPHHGRLAVAAADAWCSFMLDALADQAVPQTPKP